MSGLFHLLSGRAEVDGVMEAGGGGRTRETREFLMQQRLRVWLQAVFGRTNKPHCTHVST